MLESCCQDLNVPRAGHAQTEACRHWAPEHERAGGHRRVAFSEPATLCKPQKCSYRKRGEDQGWVPETDFSTAAKRNGPDTSISIGEPHKTTLSRRKKMKKDAGMCILKDIKQYVVHGYMCVNAFSRDKNNGHQTCSELPVGEGGAGNEGCSRPLSEMLHFFLDKTMQCNKMLTFVN